MALLQGIVPAAVCGTIIAAMAAASGAEEPAHNALSPLEREQGWRLLFDGATTSGWRGFQKPSFPDQGWVVADGCLECLGTKGGDLVTSETFVDFELAWEWRLSPQGNSGVKYFVDEHRADAQGKVYGSAIAHEYQMIDDQGYPEPLRDRQRTGSWYDVLAPRDARPAALGTFNRSRLVVRGTHLEHWLNGVQVVAYETDSAASAAAIAESKFQHVPGYADKIATPILLQDHSTRVWFRDLKLRPLLAR